MAGCAGESRCRQYEESSCKYGGHCNFMHIKRPSRDVCKRLGIRTTYEAARGGGGGGGGGGYGGDRGYGMRDLHPSPISARAGGRNASSRMRLFLPACVRVVACWRCAKCRAVPRTRLVPWRANCTAVQKSGEEVAVKACMRGVRGRACEWSRGSRLCVCA